MINIFFNSAAFHVQWLEYKRMPAVSASRRRQKYNCIAVIQLSSSSFGRYIYVICTICELRVCESVCVVLCVFTC